MRRVLFRSFFILLFIACSCTRKAPEDSASFLERQALLKHLPVTSVGFFSWNLSSPAYLKLKNSKWGKTTQLGQVLENFDANQNQEMAAFVNTIKESGLIDDLKTGRLDSKEGVAFVDIQGNQPNFALYLTGGEKADFTLLLKKVERGLKQQGLQATPIEVAGVPSLQVKDGNKKIIVGAKRKLLAAATEEALVANLFQSNPGGIKHLKSRESFKKLSESFTISGEEFAFGFLDLAEGLQKSLPKGAGTPQEIKDLPVEAFAFSSRMSSVPANSFVMAIRPKTDLQNEIFNSLEGSSGGGGVLEKLSSDLAVSLTLDGKPLPQIKKAILTTVPPSQLGTMGAQLNLLDIISSLSIGIGTNAPGSLFPDLVIQMGSEKIDVLESSIKTSLSPLKSTGMFMGDWQSKNIAGVEAEFLLSPMGVGIFLGKVGGVLVLGSSESALAGSVNALQGKVENIRMSLSPSLQKSIDDSSPLFLTYINFVKVSEIAKGASGTLSMFSGGNPGFDTSKIDELRELGRIIISVSYKDKIAKVNTNYAEVKQ